MREASRGSRLVMFALALLDKTISMYPKDLSTYESREQRVGAEGTALALIIRVQNDEDVFELWQLASVSYEVNQSTYRHHHSERPYYHYLLVSNVQSNRCFFAVECVPERTPTRSWCDGSEVKVEEYT